MKEINTLVGSTHNEIEKRSFFVKMLQNTPIPDNELLSNLGLYLNRQTLSRILFMHELYKKIINVHGIIMEFGVRWGQNLSLFSSFRGMYEPYNYNRKIIGFDTFEGFVDVDSKDGGLAKRGDYNVTAGYEEYLEKILEYHQSESPIPHKRKFDLIKGDASITITNYLNEHPETIISLAYFDFDVYKPTKVCLEAIKPHLTKGAIVGFDELNYEAFPGETLAFNEVLGINNRVIHRDPLNPLCTYIIF